MRNGSRIAFKQVLIVWLVVAFLATALAVAFREGYWFGYSTAVRRMCYDMKQRGGLPPWYDCEKGRR